MTHTSHTDHHFQIGEWHLRSGMPCQDYALSETYGHIAFGIVSDGCSSAGSTDIGARLLTSATAAALREIREFGETIAPETAIGYVRARQKEILDAAGSLLRVGQDDLLATCIHAYVDEHRGIVLVQGDGVVAIRLNNGNTIAHRLEWDGNMPFYPAYRNGRLDRFVEAHGADIDADRLTEDCFVSDGSREWKPFFSARRHSLKAGMGGIRIDIGPELLEETEFIALFTDGITQIDRIDWKDAISEFLAFRHVAGAFAKRRIMRGIEGMRKAGSVQQDDIACAVIRIARGNENKTGGTS
ncbi:MAG: protein phosphatase 2C domain-containing protein [Candidatus Moraniibacteriota bacterium]